MSHKAVHKDFVPAPEFQMTHSDSVLAGRSPDSCLREDPTEQSAQRQLIIHCLSLSKARAGRPNEPVEVAYPLHLPARAPRGSFTPPDGQSQFLNQIALRMLIPIPPSSGLSSAAQQHTFTWISLSESPAGVEIFPSPCTSALHFVLARYKKSFQ